jgi:dTDP-4-dehydrorhamnose 3,5-epimerase
VNWTIEETEIQDCVLINHQTFFDSRGAFSEIYKESEFVRLGLPLMVQDNQVTTRKGGVRAMHWQDGVFSQAKLVSVVIGEIFDVVYDLRSDSPTYGTFKSFLLNSESPLLYVPSGCAHGFQAISKNTLVHYKTDREYNANSQRAFLWNDPDVGIPWPLKEAIVSEKDAQAPLLRDISK